MSTIERWAGLAIALSPRRSPPRAPRSPPRASGGSSTPAARTPRRTACERFPARTTNPPLNPGGRQILAGCQTASAGRVRAGVAAGGPRRPDHRATAGRMLITCGEERCRSWIPSVHAWFSDMEYLHRDRLEIVRAEFLAGLDANPGRGTKSVPERSRVTPSMPTASVKNAM